MVAGQIDEAQIRRAASIIDAGGIVVYPTETVYGIGADPFSREAIMKVFNAKMRPAGMPLSVAVKDVDEMGRFAVVNDEARILARTFLPGPLTIVMKKVGGLPDELTGGLGTVGIRIPDHPIASRLIEAAGPITATSANISGRQSPTTADDAKAQMGPRADIILDGGKCRVGMESTVVDVSGYPNPFKIIREGALSRELIESALRKA